ncbi:MAG TPA: helix-turn-helix transcriptional regulator [Actinomycetota bacterium]|jgi:DNA-binding transcriptional regulator YiaG|nr:helix-turn-helix transcriptional regulator [Actinomycetota bacterium]
MAADARGPMVTDAHRLLEVVGRLSTWEFARLFREGLSSAELMQAITALPTGRLNGLMEHVRRSGAHASSLSAQREFASRGWLATKIRQARKRAGMSQVELAAALGIRQSSVSQWERGVTEPSTQNLLDLMSVLPGLAEILTATTAQRANPGGEARSRVGRPG